MSCLILKYGFCKKLHRYKWTSDQLNTFVLTFCPDQHWSGQKVRKKFICIEVTSYKIHTLAMSTKLVAQNSKISSAFVIIDPVNVLRSKSKTFLKFIVFNCANPLVPQQTKICNYSEPLIGEAKMGMIITWPWFWQALLLFLQFVIFSDSFWLFIKYRLWRKPDFALKRVNNGDFFLK